MGNESKWGVQEVSGGMWLQIPGVDGIQNGLLEKSVLGCFSPTSGGIEGS